MMKKYSPPHQKLWCRGLLIIITAVFLISSVYVAIEVSATGAEMRTLEVTRIGFESAKSELEGVLVKGMSGTEMDTKSTNLGFVKPADLIYLNGDAHKNQALINTLSR